MYIMNSQSHNNREYNEISSIRNELAHNGFLVVREIFPKELMTQFYHEFENMWDFPPSQCRIEVENNRKDGMTLSEAKKLNLRQCHYRIVNSDLFLPSVQLMVNHAKIRSLFLKLFGYPPIFCQSLTFEWPTEQSIHQDWCFVDTCGPNVQNMVAVWIACDKIDSDNGPLLYYPGSHVIPRYDYKDTTSAGFGPYLEDQMVSKKLSSELFFADPGDILLWDGDLVHGGSTAFDKEKRRLSLVFHYTFHTSHRMNMHTRIHELKKYMKKILR